MIDLHTHTTASDGSFTPVELVDYAVKKKLSAIAITDHDTMDGIQEAIDYIRESGLSLELIPGMEISTHYSGAPFGLHILAYFIVTDDKKLSDILINFNRDIQQSSGTPSDAIDIVSRYGGISVLAHPKEYYLSSSELHTLVEELVSYGLKGVECIYTIHSEAETEQYKKVASQYGLLVTGGTDFHGSRKPGVDLGSGFGDMTIPYNIVSSLKENVVASV